MEINIYALAILLALAAGGISSRFLAKRMGIPAVTWFYSAFFNYAAVVLVSFNMTFIMSRGTMLGFASMGGALGLMAGLVFAEVLFRESRGRIFISWVLSAPFMFGISKLGCLYAGCCSGTFLGLPIQGVESASFIVIYMVSLLVFFINDDKMVSVFTAMALSFAARFFLDFFRDEHSGTVLSSAQIMTLIAGIIAAMVLGYLRIRNRGKGELEIG